MGLGESLMKVVVRVRDAVELARRFESSPREAMREVVEHVRDGVRQTLEEVMDAEIGLFLGQSAEQSNKRNGYVTRTFAIKGLGAIQLRVPRDRAGRFDSNVVPSGRQYDEAVEHDLALLHLAGLSTRMLAHLSEQIVGVKVSHMEASRSLKTLLPAAKSFLERPLAGRRYKYLYVDGTFFHVRRTTVEREPTLVVLGVDESDRRSILAMIQGDKDAVDAWRMVFARLKERGLDPSAVELGIMDGLNGLQAAFGESFRNARTARCWVHKARNVLPRVPRRYQSAFMTSWNAVAYANDGASARAAFDALKARWSSTCVDAVDSMERDIDALLVHYDFPVPHWDALRTTNPIERVNKEFKRRSKAMETVGPDGLKILLAFTALRLEFGWATSPISSNKLSHLSSRALWEAKQLEGLNKGLIN
jgi:putative transposase